MNSDCQSFLSALFQPVLFSTRWSWSLLEKPLYELYECDVDAPQFSSSSSSPHDKQNPCDKVCTSCCLSLCERNVPPQKTVLPSGNPWLPTKLATKGTDIRRARVFNSLWPVQLCMHSTGTGARGKAGCHWSDMYVAQIHVHLQPESTLHTLRRSPYLLVHVYDTRV